MSRQIEAFTEGETGEVSINAVYDKDNESPSKLVIRDNRIRDDVLSSWKALPSNIDEYQVYFDYSQPSNMLVMTDMVITKDGESYSVDIGESGFFSNIADDFVDEEIDSMLNELYDESVQVYDWHYYMRVLLSVKRNIIQTVRSKLSIRERLLSPF